MAKQLYSLVSPYSFVMAVLWFSTFVVLALLLKKLRFPLRFSVVPLLGVLLLSIFRLVFPLIVPEVHIIRSWVIYPVFLDLVRFELPFLGMIGIHINIGELLLAVWLVGSVFMFVRYLRKYLRGQRTLRNIQGKRDPRAEAVLLTIDPKSLPGGAQVLRTSKTGIPFQAGILGCRIYLPETEFEEPELTGILRHEWSHFKNKDILIEVVANIICCVYWWNPLVYLLRRNISLALELKSDYRALEHMSEEEIVDYYQMIERLAEAQRAAESAQSMSLTGDETEEELTERNRLKKSRFQAQGKRIATQVLSVVLMLGLFVVSYAFIIQPAAMPDIEYTRSYEEHMENDGLVYMPTTSYLIDNGDGTYGVFMDGHYLKDITEENALFEVLEIHKEHPEN